MITDLEFGWYGLAGSEGRALARLISNEIDEFFRMSGLIESVNIFGAANAILIDYTEPLE